MCIRDSVEDVIRTCLGSCFGDFHPQDAAVLRVTRNADIDPDDEGVEEEEEMCIRDR